jgi:hypothetical protein
MTVEQLRAQVEQARVASIARVKDVVETVKLQAQLNLYTNDALQLAQAKADIRQANASKLELFSKSCEEIVASMPVYDKKTRENKKWRPSGVYGFGSEVGKVVSLLSGIQYSASVHKEQMLALVNLTESDIETTLEAIGSLPYYSKNYMTVVEGMPMNVDAALEQVTLVANKLGITVDTSKLTQANYTTQHTTSYARAKAQLDADMKSLALDTVTI